MSIPGKTLTSKTLASIAIISLGLSLAGCSGSPASTQTTQQPAPAASPTPAAAPSSSVIFVAEGPDSPPWLTINNNPSSLVSYQIQRDGSLNQVGSIARSVFPASIFEAAMAGPWLFACDLDSNVQKGRCLEFRVDSSGNVTPGADISANALPGIVAIDPSGQWLLTNGGTLVTPHMFKIQADGTLVPGPDPPFQYVGMAIVGENDPTVIDHFDPTGNFFFARDVSDAHTTSGIYRFDSATGTFTFASSLPPELLEMTNPLGFSADGKWLLELRWDVGEPALPSDIYTFSWDSVNGVLAPSGRLNLPLPSQGFYAAADSLLFVWTDPPDGYRVLRVDPATATFTDTGQTFPPGLAALVQPVAIDARTHTIVVPDETRNILSVLKYDPATAQVTQIPASPYATVQSDMIVSLVQH